MHSPMAQTWRSTLIAMGVVAETIRHSSESVIETEIRQSIGSQRRSRSSSGSGAPPYRGSGVEIRPSIGAPSEPSSPEPPCQGRIRRINIRASRDCFGGEQTDEDAEDDRARGGGVAGVGERRDARADERGGGAAEPPRRLEREHGVARRRGPLDGEEVVDAVEGGRQVGRRGVHGARVAPPDAIWQRLARRRYAALLGTGVCCTIRMLLPDGSRNPASTPYGRSLGSSVNSTPRAFSSS